MDFPGSRFPQEFYNPAAGRSADDGIIDQYNTFSGYDVFDRGKFNLYLIQPMIRRNERPADIFVFDQTDSVGYAGSPAESQRSIQSGIGHADHDIRLRRVRLRQAFTGTEAGRMNGDSVQDRIRPGEIDVFKDAMTRFCFSAVFPPGLNAVFAEDQDFARFHIPDHLRSHRMQGAAFRSDDPGSVRRLSITQRAESVRIPCADQFLRRHQHKGVSALQLFHGTAQRFLDGRRFQSLLGHNICNGFRIAGGMEDRAVHFQRGPQLRRVGKIAVMGQGHMAFLVIHFNGLTVVPVRAAGGAVPGMPDGHGSLRKRMQNAAVKHLSDETDILVGNKNPVVVHNNAAAFLSPMLQGVKSEVHQTGHILRLFCHHPEYAAFLMNSHTAGPILPPKKAKKPIQLLCLPENVSPGSGCVNARNTNNTWFSATVQPGTFFRRMAI